MPDRPATPDTQTLGQTIRRVMHERGRTHESMPKYMRQANEKINAGHDALDALLATVARLEAERDELRDEVAAGDRAFREALRHRDEALKETNSRRERKVLCEQLERRVADLEAALRTICDIGETRDVLVAEAALRPKDGA